MEWNGIEQNRTEQDRIEYSALPCGRGGLWLDSPRCLQSLSSSVQLRSSLGGPGIPSPDRCSWHRFSNVNAGSLAASPSRGTPFCSSPLCQCWAPRSVTSHGPFQAQIPNKDCGRCLPSPCASALCSCAWRGRHSPASPAPGDTGSVFQRFRPWKEAFAAGRWPCVRAAQEPAVNGTGRHLQGGQCHCGRRAFCYK